MTYIRRSYSGQVPDRVRILDIILFRADSGVRDSAQPKRQSVKAGESVEAEEAHRYDWFFQVDSLNVSQDNPQDIAQTLRLDVNVKRCLFGILICRTIIRYSTPLLECLLTDSPADNENVFVQCSYLMG